MKINELRIGNLIYEIVDTPENPKYKDEFEIAGINAVYDTLHDQDDNITLLSYCESIPLTEEWLLKFEFVIEGIKYWKNVFSCVKTHGGFLFWHRGHSLLIIKYVHQLQNLYFALTGEELKINKNI